MTETVTGTNATPEDEGRRPVRRALVSVYDKTGLDDLARGLHEAGVALVSTGSTASRIADAGVPVTRVEEVTGFPECLDGRVKTLHPHVHAGILADLRLESHRDPARRARRGAVRPGRVQPLPVRRHRDVGRLRRTSASSRSTSAGPSMVRAAAKNHPSVAIVTAPSTYDEVLDAVRSGGFTLQQRRRLAAEAFVHTATYDVHVASWMGNVVSDTGDGTGFPAWMGGTWEKSAVLRYGENPHQTAALYTSGFAPEGGLAQATQLHGKEMSYNNYVDADAARRAAYDFDEPAVAIIKHANPCGIAVGSRRRRGPPQGARLRPGLGVRRRDRHQRAGEQGDGRAGRRGVHRGRRRAGLRRRRGRGAREEEEHPAARVRAAQCGAASRSGRCRAGCSCRPATRSMPAPTTAATTRPRGGWPAVIRRRRQTSPTWSSPGGPAAP